MTKTFDPLACIPSADAIRKRLDETRELARKLAILLKTAEGLEAQVPLFHTPEIEGETSLLAYIIRVGGENPPTATIRVDNARLTVPIVSQEVAEKLGPSLYRFVELHGKATWRASDWELTDFRILDVGPYREDKSNPRAALDELAAASDSIWDSIDPNEFVRELRED